MSKMPSSGGLFARLKALLSSRSADPEMERQKWLREKGRIVEGIVIDLVQNGRSITEQELVSSSPCTILYRYHTFGVTYESAHTLSENQLKHLQDYRVGAGISVWYDARRPANSFVE